MLILFLAAFFGVSIAVSFVSIYFGDYYGAIAWGVVAACAWRFYWVNYENLFERAHGHKRKEVDETEDEDDTGGKA